MVESTQKMATETLKPIRAAKSRRLVIVVSAAEEKLKRSTRKFNEDTR